MLGFTDSRLLSDVLPAKEARAIKSAFGYTTCQELLEHYPRTWSKRGSLVDLNSSEAGEIVTCVGRIISTHERYTSSGKTMFTAKVSDGSHQLDIVFFNARWVKNILHEGVVVMLSGKLSFFRERAQLSHPDFIVISGGKNVSTKNLRALQAYGNALDIDELLSAREYIPVYPATKTMVSWRIMGAIHHVLETLPPIPEPLDACPDGLVSFDAALRGIHEPDERGPEPFMERLKYNEALELALVMAVRRHNAAGYVAPQCQPTEDGQRARLLESLPFTLTKSQRDVVKQISEDLARNTPMARLLEGEVGSGKTIVALIAMLQALDAGRQCALLAPTEVLAAQHARSLMSLVGKAGLTTSIVLLTGSMTQAQKKRALLNVVSGQADIVVGTHALIQDTVEFFDLGLIIVDEQHRFGVEQRDRLRSKGREGVTPHLLVMTATPIPRTIAMTVFGDLEVSTLRELPGGRKPIQTAVVPESKPAWMARAWDRIREEVEAGHQAYVVCPRIEGEGGVLEVFKRLSTDVFSDLSLGLLHGKMSGEDKDAAMTAFACGQIDILVSTTVVEVGVDVPNATLMLILEADILGVSQLHQLRGRVGRGGFASWCLLHTRLPQDTPAYQRLVTVADISDGFTLAQLDLQYRQEGDVLGSAQSGTTKTVKLLSVLSDREIIERAHGDACEITNRNPQLAARLASDINGEYLVKS